MKYFFVRPIALVQIHFLIVRNNCDLEEFVSILATEQYGACTWMLDIFIRIT